MGMKKLILFFIFIFGFISSYSQYKIRINWNKPVPKQKLAVKETKPISKKVIPDSNVIVSNSIKDTALKCYKPKLDSFIDKWLGVKYVFGGDSKKGIDCSAFVRRLYKAVYDKSLPRTCIYQYQIVEKIKKECLEIGDLIFFRTKGGSGWHVGVFLGDGNFVHASGRGKNVMFSNLNEDFYKKIYFSSGRF